MRMYSRKRSQRTVKAVLRGVIFFGVGQLAVTLVYHHDLK